MRVAASRRLFLYDENRARTILMDIRPIRSSSDYEEALREIERLWTPRQELQKKTDLMY